MSTGVYHLRGVDHKMVHINASNKSYGTNTNFTIDFLTRDLDKVRKVTMIKASLPRLFTNIWSANNVIDIQHPAGVDNFFTVPAGQYTATTLAAALTTACSGINMAFALNSTTDRIRATYSGVTTATLVADPTKSTIAQYIGLTSDITLGSPTDMQDPTQLSGPDEIFIKSQLVAASSTVEAGDTAAISLVGSISFTAVPYGFTGRFDSHGLDIAHVEFQDVVCMRRMDILLTDVYGNEISLPNNSYLDMILQFTY